MSSFDFLNGSGPLMSFDARVIEDGGIRKSSSRTA